MAEVNYYYCCRCGEITRQIEISMQEMEAAMDQVHLWNYADL